MCICNSVASLSRMNHVCLLALFCLSLVISCGGNSGMEDNTSKLITHLGNDSETSSVHNGDFVDSTFIQISPDVACSLDTGVTPLSVVFDASGSRGSISEYHWDFGDGQKDEGMCVEHTFQEPGNYTIVLSLFGVYEQAFDTVTVCLLPVELIGIQDRIETYRRENHPETEIAYWIESSEYGSVYSNADEIWPTASTIKVFILIAAYLEFKEFWNEVPEELHQILNSERGFAEPFEMFDTIGRENIREKLSGMTYRDLAISMMGVNQEQIGNSAYNAACNVLIFLLGGDEGCCTEKIHAISPEFSSVNIGRYMLEERTPENDNRNSMRSIAAACRMIYNNNIPGTDRAGCQAIRNCFQKFFFRGYDNYQKRGHLSTEPSLTAWVGWIEKDGKFLLYGINALYPDGVSLEDRGADYYRDIIRDMLVEL